VSVDGRESATTSQRIQLEAGSADETRAVGRRLAAVLRAGDVVVLSGDLGAGKTTFAQGIGAGLGIRGLVTSPTFVISRVHPSVVGGPALVHVDAYRVSGAAELDDLDLDETLEDAVTVVEWGDGLAESLAQDRLRVQLRRARGDDTVGTGTATGSELLDGDEPRTIVVEAIGARWDGVVLRDLLAERPGSCS
jgi:tRNA threonylcarbamoyladenosine biosynthesis protein TsaE